MLFLAAWIFIAISPVLAIENVGANVFTERYLYIPSLGFCLLLSAFIMRRLSRRFAVTVIGVLIILYGAATVMRNPVWRDSKTVFLGTVAASPDAAGIYNGLGSVYSQEGNLKEAHRAFELGLAACERNFMKPPKDKAGALFGLSYIAESEGRLPEAYRYAEDGLRLLPQDFESQLIVGRLLLKLGKLDEAEKHLRLSLQLNAENANTHITLGNIFVLRSDWQNAELELRTALKLNPDSFEARVVLGLILQQTNRLSEAYSIVQAAVASNPGNAAGQQLLREIYMALQSQKRH